MQLLGLTRLACSAVSASAQSAKDVKGSTPLVAIQNEPPVKLIVDPPIPEQLALGRVFIQRKKLPASAGSWPSSRNFLATFFYPRRLIAEAIVFATTDRASFIYGAKLAVDGGRTAI
jgi:hypothetical protein